MQLLKLSVVFILISVLVIHCNSHLIKRSAENEDDTVSSTIDPNSTDKSISLDCLKSADDSGSSDSSDDSDNSDSSENSNDSDSSENSDSLDRFVCYESTTEAPSDQDNEKEDDTDTTDEPTN